MTTSTTEVENSAMSLAWAMNSLTREQGKELDRLRLHEAIGDYQVALDSLAIDGHIPAQSDWQGLVQSIAEKAGIDSIELFDQADPARLPLLTWVPSLGWGIIRSLSAQQQWVVDCQGVVQLISAASALPCVRLTLAVDKTHLKDKPAYRLFRDIFDAQRKIFVEAGVAGVVINLLALATSLYSMQVYDRVIPTQGYSTLLVLTLGVSIAMIFDLVIKFARSHLMESATQNMDSHLARQIFARFLNLRLDQLPSTVGSLSGQLRGFETIRAFISAKTLYLFIDAPFGLFFILMIALIGSPLAALVPLSFLLLAIAFGFVMREKIDAHAISSSDAANKKTGVLVEAIEGAETIKSGGGSWKMLSKWIDVSDEAMKHDMVLRGITEKNSYISGMLQQVSYVGLISVGAYLAAEGHMTMGALIACSILSGRAMAPVAQIPGLMVQAAHARAALKHLENVFALERDNHEVERPIIPEKLRGHFILERVRFAYQGMQKALYIPSLLIKPGEKIGLIGPIGAGKSTLLRILTGMYRANEGRVLLDNLDINQVSRQFLGERIAYLQQDHRLFSGTLRENLLIGIPDPGDEAIRSIAEKTGLLALISNHPKGLDLPIAEGGKGLSGGQRQLLAFTRLLLSKPDIWLLDEPTASMDSATEQRCMSLLAQAIKPQDTVVLVTHKQHLLRFVNRLICIVNHQILIDGPRDEVLKKLAENIAMQSQNAVPETTSSLSTGSV